MALTVIFSPRFVQVGIRVSGGGCRVTRVGFAVVADSPATSRPIQLLGLQEALHLHSGTDEALAALLPSA